MNTDKQKGVSLIITFFIMVIVLAVVLSVSILLYSEVKIIRNIGDSAISLFSADSGIEKILYYDNQVIPDGAVRGICSMCREEEATSCVRSSVDEVMACSSCEYTASVTDSPTIPDNPEKGCDPDTCNYCSVTFSTTLSNKMAYNVRAEVFPSVDGEFTDLRVRSKGSYYATQRQLEILTRTIRSKDAISIRNACATPIATKQGNSVAISAEVTSNIPGYRIGTVVAKIHDASNNIFGTIALVKDPEDPTQKRYMNSWPANSNSGTYYVDIFAMDTSSEENPNVVTKINIPPYPFCIDNTN